MLEPEPSRADSGPVPTLRLVVPLVLCLPFAAACTGFREVRPGVYRSGQPGEDQLFRRIAAFDLRTVVCLRGRSEHTAASARASEGAGIHFWNVPMSATRRPRPETLHELWHVAATAERPLLLHCRAGVDRTGLAAAIVVLHDTGDLAAARAQLAVIPHGHLGMLGTEAMDEVLDRYELYADRLTFPQWIDQVYAGEFAAAPR